MCSESPNLYATPVPVCPSTQLSSTSNPAPAIQSAHQPIRRRQVSRLENLTNSSAHFGSERHSHYKARSNQHPLLPHRCRPRQVHSPSEQGIKKRLVRHIILSDSLSFDSYDGLLDITHGPSVTASSTTTTRDPSSATLTATERKTSLSP